MLRTILAALSAVFLLQASACDKGADKKAPEKKAEPEKTDTADAGEPAGTTTTTGAPEEPGTTTTTGEPAEGETGVAEGGAKAEDDGGDKADDGKADDGKGDDKGGDDKGGDDKGDDDKGGDDGGEKAAKVDGKGLFEGKCKSCHGADGKGDTTIGKKVDIPSLAGTKLSKSAVVKKVENGVPDTKMKGYKDKLSKEEIDAVASYVKKL